VYVPALVVPDNTSSLMPWPETLAEYVPSIFPRSCAAHTSRAFFALWIPTSGRLMVSCWSWLAQFMIATTVFPPDSGPAQTSYCSSENRRINCAACPSASWFIAMTSAFEKILSASPFSMLFSSPAPINSGDFSIAQILKCVRDSVGVRTPLPTYPISIFHNNKRKKRMYHQHIHIVKIPRLRVLRQRHNLVCNPIDRAPSIQDIIRHPPAIRDLPRPLRKVVSNSPLANPKDDISRCRPQRRRHGAESLAGVLVRVVDDVIFSV